MTTASARTGGTTAPPIMQGKLKDCALESLLEIASIGRQLIAIELRSERGEEIGMILLKSGKVLRARAGKVADVDAVRSLISAPRDAHFSMIPQPDAGFGDVRSPIGSIRDVLAQVARSGLNGIAPESGRTSVMSGDFTEFDLPSIVQVVSLGRQLTTIEVTTPRGEPVGRIVVKAPRVLSATFGGEHGVGAFQKLMRVDRSFHFSVHRSSFHDDFGEGLGLLHELVLEASEPELTTEMIREDDWEDPGEQKPPPKPPAAPRAGFAKPPIPPPANTSDVTKEDRISQALTNLTMTTRSVLGACIVTREGLMVGSVIRSSAADGDTIGGMAASLLSVGEQAAGALLRSRMDQMTLRSPTGYVVVHPLGEDAAVVMLLNHDAMLGLALLEMKKTTTELAGFV